MVEVIVKGHPEGKLKTPKPKPRGIGERRMRKLVPHQPLCPAQGFHNHSSQKNKSGIA
jgi:hypothetical protein